ncbi:hypothetical protein, partial [Streptomyces neyagawaensis]|uniref:hypothetical protein n=1 Tax=Streptomyces neyagawaensis TaxID=42238 RepID=UPI003F4D51B4
MACYKAGEPSRLIYRPRADSRPDGRKGFSWKEYRDIVKTVHQQLGGAIVGSLSRRTLAVTADLPANGATAVQNESSGVACGRERWLALAREAAAAETADDLVGALVRAWVVPVIHDGEVYYSCGIHLLREAHVEPAPGTRKHRDARTGAAVGVSD